MVEEGAPLRSYVLAKQDVVDAIRAAKRACEGSGASGEAAGCQGLLVKLAEDRFNLVVVGQFKRGKSSLMNAVIGRELLPTGVLPLTSAVTTLCYGPEERVLLKHEGWAFDQEIPLRELAAYVTEEGNPGNEKAVLEARVTVPLPFLRRGLHFIDTPGVGSTRRENTATTYAFLPEADAVIFVTSGDAALSEAEHEFLGDIRQHARKVFVVVNKMDLLAPTERERVLSYVGHGIAQTLALDDVRLFPLSARDGLAAKLRADRDGVRASGLEEFEDALARFLGTEKERTFLVAILERAAPLLRTDTPQSRDARARIESVHERLLAGVTGAGARGRGRDEEGDARFFERAVIAESHGSPRGEEREGVRAGTCPICTAQAHALVTAFAKWQYLLATEDAAQRAFASARGFCHAHTWQFQQIASPQGISEGYAALVDAAGGELRKALEESPRDAVARIGTLLPSSATCPACRALHDVEEEQARRGLEQLGSVEIDAEEPRAELPALCLPHLRVALERAPSTQVVELLLREGARRLDELSEDLRSYGLKRAALRRGLLNADEESAWRRALVALVGERAGRGPWSDAVER